MNATSALFYRSMIEGSLTSGSHVFHSCFQSLMKEIAIVRHCDCFCSDGLSQISPLHLG